MQAQAVSRSRGMFHFSYPRSGVMDGTMRKIRWIPVLVAGAGCVAPADCAVALQPPQQKATKSAPAVPKSSGVPTAAGSSAPADRSVPPQPVLTSRCSSDGRKAALVCEIEQSLYITKTGQLVASDQCEAASRHTPARDDDSASTRLKGCYAATTVSPQLLGSMKSGKRLSAIFQNLNKENVNFAFVLSSFAEGYDKISY